MTAVGIVNWSEEDAPGLSVLTVITKSSAGAAGAAETGSPGKKRKPARITEAKKTFKNLKRIAVCIDVLLYYSGPENN